MTSHNNNKSNEDIEREIIQFYQDGKYSDVIKLIDFNTKDLKRVAILIDCFLKSNRTDVIPALSLFFLNAVLQSQDEKYFLDVFNLLKKNHVLQVVNSIAVNSFFVDKKILDGFTPDFASRKIFNGKDEIDYSQLKIEKNDDKNLSAVFPIIWPIAFGDFVVIMQFIKTIKKQFKKTLIIAPFNRPELVELRKIGHEHGVFDYSIDITTIEAGVNRNETLGIPITVDGQVLLNVAYQELMIAYILKNITIPHTIFKLRYLPVLQNMVYNSFRIWETRADLFLNKNGLELEKIVEQKEEKQNQIIIHFRDADYGDPARNININYATALISEIKKAYPDYKIVRLGDKSMPVISGVDLDLALNPVSVFDQIKEIQRSKLFIGSHSAPQHLAIAGSDTPIICINYTAQETTNDFSKPNIALMSYEPVGKQVKAILYATMLDEHGNNTIPIQNNPVAKQTLPSDLNIVMQEIKKVLG